MYKLKIILGSTRSGRVGDRVAKLVQTLTKDYTDLDVELVDLKDYPLPFYNETLPISLVKDYSTPIIPKWKEKVGDSDAFIIVTAEYNHGVPAALKNALDYAYLEWKRKPVMLVGYSNGAVGGSRAVEQLREIVGAFDMADLNAGLLLTFITEKSFDENGNYLDIEKVKPFFQKAMAELLWWTKTLKKGREETA